MVESGFSRRQLLAGAAAAGSGAALATFLPVGAWAAAQTAAGVDYSAAPPRPSAIKAAGYTFVMRYLSHTSAKNLSPGEAQALSDAGISIGVVRETTAQRALDGQQAGILDAQAAIDQATACGMPVSRPIYFGVDFDAAESQPPAINAYFDGVRSVLGTARTGAYGGFYVIKRLFDGGRIAFGWQTQAWSGGQWDPRAQVQQYARTVTIDGTQCDIDASFAADYGQWQVGASGGATKDTVGWFRQADGSFHLLNTNAAGSSTNPFVGAATGSNLWPIAGSWT